MCDGKAALSYVRNDVLHTGPTEDFRSSYPGATPDGERLYTTIFRRTCFPLLLYISPQRCSY